MHYTIEIDSSQWPEMDMTEEMTYWNELSMNRHKYLYLILCLLQ